MTFLTIEIIIQQLNFRIGIEGLLFEMTENQTAESNRELDILENIEKNPNATQASIAAQMNVAIGTVNLHLKRLIDDGFIKIQHSEKRKLKYIITPEGAALRAKLTMDYINNSFELYRLIRRRMNSVLDNCEAGGYSSIYIDGDGDVADICKLTCIERGIKPMEKKHSDCPVVKISALKLFFECPVQEDKSTGERN